MSESKAMQVGGFLTVFAIGAVAGAAIALLYAPHSGEETRKLIADKGGELKGKAADAIAKARDFIGGGKSGTEAGASRTDA
jgi:gas vesicle protein